MKILAWIIAFLFATGSVFAQGDTMQYTAKFLPPEGKTLLIIGQDLGAVGGLPNYTDGYADHIQLTPGGVTTYTDIANLNGLTHLANWGSGDVSAQLLADEPRYSASALVMGLWMTGSEARVADGTLDTQVDALGEWIKAQNRPVYLRIGYEFDGEWNAYEPEGYVAAFRHIVDRFRATGVDNAATVWQSATHHSPHYGGHEWIEWYPGDDYVDWFALSYFEPRLPILNAFLDLARAHNKPVMIAESAPKGASTSATTRPELLWEGWYQPFFDFIYTNSDVIRAVAYINVDWDSQPMWANHEDRWGDSRVQANEVIAAHWLSEIRKPAWLHGSSTLFTQLGYPSSPAPAENAASPDTDWRLIWSDEFDGDSLDTDHWNTTLRDMPGAAGQRYHNTSYAQYLMDDDTIVQDGLLRLRAQRRTIVGDDPPGSYDYSAGWVSTYDKFDFTYGYVEIRARYPAGVGMWPAFWTLASDNVWGPEFDIAEYFGNQQRMHFGLMYSEYPAVNWNSQHYRTASWETDWHTYALEWSPGEAHFIVDGQILHTILADYVPAEPMYVILQNGVGTASGPAGAPNSETVFPNFFDIDYLRVYQRASQARILNRGFETGTTDGWQVSPLVDVLRRDVRSGHFALRLLGDDTRAEQVVTGLAPDTTYRLSAWGKVSDAADTLTIGVQVDGGEAQRVQVSNTDYTQVTITFVTGASTPQATVFCAKSGASGEGFCDDFALSVVPR
ncbi:MAG: family 16 glycosylhydrolase [Chloroflexota bacterium]